MSTRRRQRIYDYRLVRLVQVPWRIDRLEAENDLLRARFPRVPCRRRPHYRRNERMDILWHAARYRLSVHQAAHAFVLSVQTVVNWHRVMRQKGAHLLSPMHALPDLVHDLVPRIKAT